MQRKPLYQVIYSSLKDLPSHSHGHFATGAGGGGSAYERDGDARGKFWIKPLKETDLGVAQAFLDP